MTRPRDFIAILLLGAAAMVSLSPVIAGLARVHTGEVVFR